MEALRIEELADKPNDELYKIFNTSGSGLGVEEVIRRRLQFGRNVFDETGKIRPLYILLGKFKNPVLLLLIGAAILSGFLGSAFSSYVILAMVFGSALIDFFNTYKSEKAALLLKEQVTVTASVYRYGEPREEKMQDIVPGDVVALVAGDLVPGDTVLLEEKDVFVDESALTGESFPVEKNATVKSMRTLWMGTSVVSGEAKALIVATGKNTKIGQIAHKLIKPEAPTDFDKSLTAFSLFIFRITIFLILSIFLINAIFPRQASIVEVFLFAVAIAVGLAPELLPMIVATNLATSALKMSKQGVIVKRLSAIHNLGTMDVLCTDKTGTLTEDKIALIKYLDPLGKEDDEVLKWGYLSSLHVTGIRGTLDKAIQEHGKIDTTGWKKVDEIPFDFQRKRDSIAVQNNKEVILISKGAPEEIFKVSTSYGKKNLKFNAIVKKKVEVEYEKLSAEGFRVLGIAIKKEKGRAELYTKDDEFGMTFMGFLAFMDPPKKNVKETLKRMEAYHVDVKIVTGDNRLVAERIAHELELPIKGVLTTDELQHLSDEDLRKKVEEVNLFTRVTPDEKERIINALRANGHVVGYMGDGVNDVLSLRAADVGISVNNAVDISKDMADIILLKKGLHEVIEGILEGRRTYANIFKYLMMALSSNFGNMVSMPVASIFLPFLPMTAPQIILNNFLYDISQFTIPFDSVSEEFLTKPKKFNIDFLRRFMIIFGPLSSLFDFLMFGILIYVFGLSGPGFQTGWFLESIATQALVVNIIRTRRRFFESRPSGILAAGSIGIVLLAWIMPYTFFRNAFGFNIPSIPLMAVIFFVVVAYLVSVEFAKRYFYKKWGYLIEKA